MCAILDANAAGEVFRRRDPAERTAGREFFEWLNAGRGRLIVGGRLLQELDGNGTFRKWRVQATLAGRVEYVGHDAVEDRTRQLRQDGVCRSNDEHVVAVAQLGGARLLYTNDGDLQRDFRDRNLIDHPRGKVYSTDPEHSGETLTPTHRRLLANRRPCRTSIGR